tara:strand:- start:1489 stop:1908 length:420 start_codon:yes stop_codon:yes gene_type:complete
MPPISVILISDDEDSSDDDDIVSNWEKTYISDSDDDDDVVEIIDLDVTEEMIDGKKYYVDAKGDIYDPETTEKVGENKELFKDDDEWSDLDDDDDEYKFDLEVDVSEEMINGKKYYVDNEGYIYDPETTEKVGKDGILW